MVLHAQLSREKVAALTYEYYTPARPRRVRQPSGQLSCQPSCRQQQLQTETRDRRQVLQNPRQRLRALSTTRPL